MLLLGAADDQAVRGWSAAAQRVCTKWSSDGSRLPFVRLKHCAWREPRVR